MKIYSIGIEHQGYDTYDAHIIVANNEQEVIEMAQEISADEGGRIWKEGSRIKIEGNYTGQKEEPFFLLSSFNAG